MPIRVSANGQIFEFPDGTSQEAMSAALRQHFQRQAAQPQEKSTWETVKDFASDAYDAADRAMQPLRDAVGYDVEAQRAKEETFQRGVREAERADLAKQDGMLDRAGDFLTRGTAGARAGVDRFASGLARTDAEQQAAIARAKANEETAATQIAGETSWEDVKSNWLNAPKFIAEKGVESLPYMASSLTGPMGVAINFGSNAGQIAQSRAQADGRENASGADVAFAAPFSAVSTALDTLSLGKMASSVGGGFLSGIALDAATEGLTEGVQSAIEYTGGSAGTKEGFSFREMGEQALQGGLVGAGVGGGFGAVQETGNAAIRRVSMRPVPKGEVETAAENVILSPEDIASPIPNDLIAEGKAITATAGASSKADSILSSAGLPGVKSRVQVDMGDGRPIGGVIEDAFSTDDSAGVKIKLDDGTIINDHFADLVDAGVKITAPSPTAEADAIAAELARKAQSAATQRDAALADMEAMPAAPEPVAEVQQPLAPAPAGDAVTSFMAKTRKVESGGKDTAKNPRSSATGRYQFTDGTWLATYRAEFGDTGESPQQILAKRSDGATQDRLMERLTSDNSKGLQAAGLPVTEGNLYLAHFAGIGGARAILKADPNTSIESVLGRDAVNANPFLKGKTAAEVVQWAAQKMGGSAAPVATEAAPVKADQVDPYEKALSDYRDWQEAQEKEAERTDATGPEMLPMPQDRQADPLPDLYHGGRAGMTVDDIQIVREPGSTKQGKKNRVYGGFYATEKLDEAQGYAAMGEGSTVYKLDLKEGATVERKDGDVTRLSPNTIDEYRQRGVDVVVGKDPRGRTEYVVINKDVVQGLIDVNQQSAPALGERLGDIPARGSPAATESTENPVTSPEATVDTTGTRQQQAGGVAADAGSRPFVGNVRGDAIDGEWRRFSPESGTLDVPRADMPQIKADDRSAMVQFLKARGIGYSEQTVPAASLKPTQAEFSEAKVQKAKEYEGGNRALLVSSDGYVLDGHHQWMAARDKGEEIRTIQLDAPIRDLLKVVPEMPSATTADGSTDTKPVEVAEAKTGGLIENFSAVESGDTVGFEAPDGRLEITRVGRDEYTVDRGTTEQTFTRAQVEQIASNEGWSISNRTKAEAQAASRENARARFQSKQQNTAGPQVDKVTGENPQETAISAPESSKAVTTPASTARIEDTGTGKSVAVIGASEADRAAIAQAVPKAQAITRKDGALVYAKKHEADIRQALASAAPAAAPATDIDPALAAGLARPTLDRAERARIASEIAASNPDVTIKGDVLSGPRTLINVQTASGEQLRAVQAKLAPQTVIPAAEVTESVTPSPAAETAATPRTPIAARAEQKADVAVTATGTEVPVNYAVVEMGDLVASNTPDGAPNPAYPADRQPRDRTRAASQTQIAEIASRLNPRLLGRSPKASDGAPIISPDGIVESGNGRTLALQRVYEQNAESAKSYRDFIASEGFDVSGMSRPVLVRIRDGNLSTEQVQDFVRAANVRDTAGMSGTETATSDAAAMPAEMLDLYRGGDIDAAGNREFVKSFVNALVPTNERASMVLSDGSIAKPLMARMEAAMLVRAFGQRPFIEKTVDATDSNIRAIGKTLAEMAGKFAKLREAARDGRVDPAMDITDNIAEAVEIIDRARREGRPISDYVNQRDIFSGTTVSQMTESALRTFFFGRPDFTKPLGQARMTEALDFYVTEAMKAAPGGGLFGESTKATPNGILQAANDRRTRTAGEQPDLLAARQPGNAVDGPRDAAPSSDDGRPAGEIIQAGPRDEGRASSEQVSGNLAADSRIEDFGEKLQGARKDVWQSYRERLADAEIVDVTVEPLSKSWPEPDYEKLIESGADPYSVAWVRAARDDIPTKPQKGWKLKGWADNVRLLRGVANQLLSGDLDAAAVQERMLSPEFRNALRDLQGRVDLYIDVGHEKSLKGITLSNHFYSLYRGEKNVTKWAIEQRAKSTAFGNWPREIAVADTREEAIAKFKEVYASGGLEKKASTIVRFDIYSRRGEPGFIIGKKIGKEYVDLKRFDDAKTARAFKVSDAGYAELVAALESYKDIPPERKAANAPRIGIDHRSGGDVTPEVFAETFGFRGVQFGNYVESGRRQSDLNEAYDALMDLAGVIGVPARALSLNGELGLAFGARGKGGKGAAAAHFEPDTIVINLTKGSGAGSLAHEWWHSLDNYFSRMRAPGGYMTEEKIAATEGVRPEMVRAFKDVMAAIRQTSLKERSSNLDKRRTKAYWSTEIEMSARAFESYVIAKLQDEQFSNDYLANIVSEKAFGVEGGYPYLTAAEIPTVRAAFDGFFGTVETEASGDGIRMFSVPDGGMDLPTVTIDVADWGNLPGNAKSRYQVLRGRVGRWYRGLIGSTITASDGKQVGFNDRGMEKTLSSAGENLLMAARAITKIIERGQALPSTPGDGAGVKAWHSYAAKVRIGNEVRPLMVYVRETQHGTFHYSINHVMDRGSPDAPAEAGRNLGKASISHAMDGGAGDRLNLFDAADVFNTRQNTDVPVADLQARLEGYGLARKVALKVVDTLNGAAGEYHNALIKVATDTAQDGTFTLDHEAVHAFRGLGMLNTSEWAVLAAKAKRDPALMRSIKQRYGRLDAEGQSEEAVADMFARYQRGDYKAEGTVARVFKMLSQALEAIRNFVAGRGIQTAEGVMGKMAAGEQAASDGLAPSASKKSIPVPLERDARIEPDQGRIEAVSSMLGEIGENGGGKLSEAADWWRVRLQDKMLPVLRVQDRIQAALGKEVAEAENPYLTEELMSGRVGARLERLSEEIVDPLLQGMQDHDVSIDELETYLYARHAQERNARIAKINPEFSEGEGSGMTDIQARAVLNRIEKSGKKDALKALASLVDKMLSDSLQTRIDAGLISQEEADAWKSTYEHYVPLRGRMEVDGDVETARVRTQSGLSIKGKEGKRAFGRRSQADSILSYSILQAEEAIIRAEKNAAAQAFLKLAQANPNEGFWTVNKIERRPVFDKASGLVRYENQSRISAEDAPYTVTAKVNGDEFHVTMERTNPEAVRLAEAMRNLEDPKFNKFMSAMSTFNRYFSAINTRYNPSFVITNALRDVETAMVTLGAEDVAGLRRGVLRDYRKALTASSDPSTEWGRWRREWEMAGGKVYYNQAGDLNAIRKDLSVRIKMKSNPSTMAKVWTKTFDALEAANEAVERAIRLSVYKNAREAGYSQAKAASLSRNVTTNFTRKGRWGPAINSFYAFFNASTQGSATFIRAVARSKKARRAVYAVMAAAFLSEMLNAMLSGTDDDGESYWDKMPEFEKQKNLIIMMPDGENGEAIKIPLAYGLNAFANLGRTAAAVLRGAVSPGEAAAGSALTFLDAFNPVGSGSPLSMISPTALDPFADMAMNENFAGKPIRPNQNPFAPDQTPSSTYTGNTSAVSKAIAKAVNKATGGDDVLPGALSLYPDHIDYAFGFLTGGTGRFIQDLVKNVTAAADPEADMTIRDMPIIKSVVTEKAPWVDKERFYSRTGEFKAFAEHAKQYIDREDYRGLQKLVDGNIPLARMEPVTKEAVKIMGQVRKDRNQVLFDREMGRIDDATARENLKRIEEAESGVVSRYNTLWNEAMSADSVEDEE